MTESIKKVYLGLPEGFELIVLWVSEEYLTNQLSHELGGSDVVIEYHSGNIVGYDRVKFPSRYIAKIFQIGMSKEYENFEKLEYDEELTIIKGEVARIFARKYNSDDYDKVPFEEIWNYKTAKNLPWEGLEKFDES